MGVTYGTSTFTDLVLITSHGGADTIPFLDIMHTNELFLNHVICGNWIAQSQCSHDMPGSVHYSTSNCKKFYCWNFTSEKAKMAACPVYSPSEFQKGLSTFMRCFKAPAAELFSQHLKTNPTHFDSWMYRGICYSILGKQDEAISDFTTAAKYGNPCEKMVMQGLGLQAQRKHEEAVLLLKQATTAYPNDPMGWHYYGVIRLYQGNADDEVASALKSAIRLNYRYSEVSHLILGQLLRSKGEVSKSIDHLRTGLSMNPTCTVNYIELGAALLEIHQCGEAKDLLLKALELNDTQVEANRLLATLYFLEKNFDAAGHHAAIFFGKTTDCKQRQRGNGGGSSSSGGGGGDDGGSGGSGSDESDGDEISNEEALKQEAVAKAVHNRIDYFKIRVGTKKKYIWVSLDKAKHGGAAFKVWKDKGATINFVSSYNENMEEMKNKHESNEGRKIKKSDMNIRWTRQKR